MYFGFLVLLLGVFILLLGLHHFGFLQYVTPGQKDGSGN